MRDALSAHARRGVGAFTLTDELRQQAHAARRAEAMRTRPSALIEHAGDIQERACSGNDASKLKAQLAASRSASFDTRPVRNERLELVTHIERGPLTHTPPADDPAFARLEPNSGVRLA